MQDLLLQNGGRGDVFIGEDVIDGGAQGIAHMHQRGQGDLDPVVLDVADMAGVHIGHVGDIFLG